MQGHESSQSAGIDIADLAEVQQNAFIPVGDSLLYFVPKQGRLLAKYDPTAARNRQNSVYCSLGKFQLHLKTLLRGAHWTQWPQLHSHILWCDQPIAGRQATQARIKISCPAVRLSPERT